MESNTDPDCSGTPKIQRLGFSCCIETEGEWLYKIQKPFGVQPSHTSIRIGPRNWPESVCPGLVRHGLVLQDCLCSFLALWAKGSFRLVAWGCLFQGCGVHRVGLYSLFGFGVGSIYTVYIWDRPGGCSLWDFQCLLYIGSRLGALTNGVCYIEARISVVVVVVFLDVEAYISSRQCPNNSDLKSPCKTLRSV